MAPTDLINVHATIAVLVLVCGVSQVVSTGPSIETDGNNLQVVLQNGGEFRVKGDSVAVSGDLTSMQTNINSAISQATSSLQSNIDGVSNNAATTDSLSTAVSGVTKSISSVNTTLNSFISSTMTTLNNDVATNSMLNSVNASLQEAIVDILGQQEITTSLQAQTKAAYGWKGVSELNTSCSVQNCPLAIFGQGFFPSSTVYNDITVDLKGAFTYKVMITPAGTTQSFTCPISAVSPNFIYCECGGLMSDPPSPQFWNSLRITEDGYTVPYAGREDTEPTQVISMTTTKPTVQTDSRSFAYTKALSPQQTTLPMNVSWQSHDTATVAFTSNNQNIVKNNDIVYTKKTDNSGTFTVKFQSLGTVLISIAVTDDLSQTTVHNVQVSMLEEYVCNAVSDFKADACTQNPIDQWWGRGSNNCMALQDGSFRWSPPTSRHIAPQNRNIPNGFAELAWSGKILYNIEVHQFHNPGAWDDAHDGYDLYVKDANGDSQTYGQWVRIQQCPKGGIDDKCQRPSGVSKFTVPTQYRYTDGFRFVRTAPFETMQTFRIEEFVFNGC